MKKLFLNMIIFFFLYSCGGNSDVGKVLRNEKITNTDEFLVKKRDPLTMPPEYETLPRPGEINTSKSKNEKDIKDILKIPKENSSTIKSSSVEQAIINEINK
tara:strand:- start:629 stop:934 length:306 start_codon:yes stop_codon:yes gene_type:complete